MLAASFLFLQLGLLWTPPHEWGQASLLNDERHMAQLFQLPRWPPANYHLLTHCSGHTGFLAVSWICQPHAVLPGSLQWLFSVPGMLCQQIFTSLTSPSFSSLYSNLTFSVKPVLAIITSLMPSLTTWPNSTFQLLFPHHIWFPYSNIMIYIELNNGLCLLSVFLDYELHEGKDFYLDCSI